MSSVSESLSSRRVSNSEEREGTGENLKKTSNGRSFHPIESLKSGTKYIARLIHSCAVRILDTLNSIKNDPDAFARLLRGVCCSVDVLKDCGVSALPQVVSRVSDVVDFVDAIQIVNDVHYLVSGEWKEDSWFGRLSHAAFAVADVGGVAMWLDQMGLGLSQVVTAIGNVRHFSFVPLIPLGTILTGFVGVGFCFIGADAAHTLYKLRNVTEAEDSKVNKKRIQAGIDLTWSAFEVVSKIMLIAAAASIIPVAGPGVIAALAVISIGFGLASFAYRAYNSSQNKQVEDQKERIDRSNAGPIMAAA